MGVKKEKSEKMTKEELKKTFTMYVENPKNFGNKEEEKVKIKLIFYFAPMNKRLKVLVFNIESI